MNGDGARPARVVLVDDHDGYRAALGEVLELSGRAAVVGAFATAAEALDFLTGGEPVDVVVCDLHLPDVDGVELCRRVRRQPGAPPVCVVSADGRRSAVVEALGAGAAGFVHKATEPEELLELLLAAASGEPAVDRATAGSLAGAQGAAAPVALSTRQLALLRGLADGLSSEALGERTGLDAEGVRRLTDRTLADLGAATETVAVAWALRNRVIE